MNELELLIDAQATLAEGPSWDERKGFLYWVDVVKKEVHIYDSQKSIDRCIKLDQMVGAAVPRESGGLVLAMEKGFYALDMETEELTLLNDPEGDLPCNRFNDGKCDEAGRFWAGTMDRNGNTNQGSLYRLDTDMNCKKMLDGLTISNGLAWDTKKQKMYFIDTPTKKIVSFDYDADSGDISNKKVVVQFPEGEGVPDGMTIDDEGMIWVAHWGGGKVSRWNPETGEFLEQILIPATQVTSCVFGGKDLDELYITTAREDLSEKSLLSQPKAGGIFKIRVGVKGSPTFFFRG